MIRDPRQNDCLRLPITGREQMMTGVSLAEARAEGGQQNADRIFSANFVFQAGQLEEIRRSYREAMGLDGDETAARSESE